MRADGRSQIHEDIELLKLTRTCDRQQARDGAFTVLAAIAKTDFAPLNGMAQGAFRRVVCRLNPLLVHEGKEVRMMLKERTGEIAHVNGGGIDVAFAQGEERFLKGKRFRDQLVAGNRTTAYVRIAAEAMPEAEEAPLQRQGLPTKAFRRRRLRQLLRVQEIPSEMRPTELALARGAGSHWAVRSALEAVRGQWNAGSVGVVCVG